MTPAELADYQRRLRELRAEREEGDGAMIVRDRCAREADHEWEHIDDDEDAEGPFAVLECQRCGRIRKEA